MKKIFYYKTPVGEIGIAEERGTVTDITFSKKDYFVEETEVIRTAANQLFEYFDGKRQIFDFPICPEGTEFQKKVWKALETIPYGQTASYKDIAEKNRKSQGMQSCRRCK